MSEVSTSSASIADVAVVMLFGWKEFGHADLSWWLVVSPWIASLAWLCVIAFVAGVIKVFA